MNPERAASGRDRKGSDLGMLLYPFCTGSSNVGPLSSQQEGTCLLSAELCTDVLPCSAVACPSGECYGVRSMALEDLTPSGGTHGHRSFII